MSSSGSFGVAAAAAAAALSSPRVSRPSSFLSASLREPELAPNVEELLDTPNVIVPDE